MKLIKIEEIMLPEIQHVVNACIMLDEAGKKPSVGMIKGKLASPLPIPAIIKGLSYWKDNKASLTIQEISPAKAAPKNSNQDLLARVAQLETEVATMRQELKALTVHLEGEEFKGDRG